MPARLIAIEGIDGAGKGTLAGNLVARARREGLQAAGFAFPRYEETRFAGLIADYLNGGFGPLESLVPQFTALLYAGDRYEAREQLAALLGANDLVLLDRYVASNMAYNAAKLPESERQALVAWIEDLEFGAFGLPRPDLTVLLDTPPATADALVARKQARAYTSRTRDLHEAAGGYMNEVAGVYRGIAAARADWRGYDPRDREGALKPASRVADEVWTLLSDVL